MGNEERVKFLESALAKTEAELQSWKNNYDDFIHLAAHDIQAPVRKITTLLDRFKQKAKDSIPDDAAVYLDRLNKSLDQITGLINDISRLSSIKSMPEKSGAIDLNIVLPIVLKSFKDKIEKEGVSITLGKLPIVYGLENDIRELFIELLSNAIKFKRKETPLEIKISSSRLDEEEKLIYNLPIENIYSIITVHDNGIGFKNDMSERIVQPFQRLHGNSEYVGNGIGLAICKKIVSVNGGIFKVEGQEMEGATFSIILPENQN